jgi:hypothetical protein
VKAVSERCQGSPGEVGTWRCGLALILPLVPPLWNSLLLPYLDACKAEKENYAFYAKEERYTSR